MALELELKTYDQLLPSLATAEGRWVAIVGERLLGVFETYEQALEAAYDVAGLGGFLVKRVAAHERTHVVTRLIRPCP